MFQRDPFRKSRRASEMFVALKCTSQIVKDDLFWN